jgi:hypothetical protein
MAPTSLKYCAASGGYFPRLHANTELRQSVIQQIGEDQKRDRAHQADKANDVSLMRAIPFLILAYLLYYGLPQLGISMEPWTAGLLILGKIIHRKMA